jgi:hypothetical protein
MIQRWGLTPAFQHADAVAASIQQAWFQGFLETTTFAGLIRRSCNW